jgi:glycosyltransferase involved in cell wall biosynthesis
LKNLSVLHLTPFVFREGQKGGGERYVQQLCLALQRQGLEITLVEAKNFYEFKLFKNQENIAKFKSLLSLVKLAKDHDLIHVHQLNRETFTVAFFLSIVTKKRLILSDHGGSSRHLFRLLGKLRLSRVAAIAAVSPWSLRDVDPQGKVKRSAVLWGGGDHLSPMQSTNYPQSDFLFIGRILPHKGVHIAIEALPEGATLVVAGERRDLVYFDYLRELAKGKKVTFLDSPPDAELFALYSSAKFFLVPSVTRFRDKIYERPELLGIVALESMYAGTPVIGSDVGGLGDLLSVTGHHLVKPGDVLAWNSRMTELLKDKDLPNANTAFTWDRSAEVCIDLYIEALKND